MQSTRRYYLLLPAQALAIQDWPNTGKYQRRAIIQEHLENVCNDVSKAQIQEVDGWLNTIYEPRENLNGFRRSLQEKYGRICFICGKEIRGAVSVDHIFPFSKGGKSTLDNLLLTHPGCNSSKGNMLPGELIRWAPESIAESLENITTRLRYLVFLRDNFTCCENDCSNGLYSGTEINLKRIHETGIQCYDNLKTVCSKCS